LRLCSNFGHCGENNLIIIPFSILNKLISDLNYLSNCPTKIQPHSLIYSTDY
jgi:hypothetical protein